MKSVIFLVILCFFNFSSIYAKCYYSSNGHFCGKDYKDNDPYVLANSECEAVYDGEGFVVPRWHVKLNGDLKVKCPAEADQARKDAYEAEKAAQESEHVSKKGRFEQALTEINSMDCATVHDYTPRDCTSLVGAEKVVCNSLNLANNRVERVSKILCKYIQYMERQ